MGLFSSLVELAGIAVKSESLNENAEKDSKIFNSMFGKAKSIAEHAKKYVLEYPTICSTTINDYDTALAIAKQVEFDCARFIILASGLNPIVKSSKGDTIEAHIKNLVTSYEEYARVPVLLREATDEDILSVEHYMNNVYSTELYNSYNRENVFSQEMTTTSVDSADGEDENELDFTEPPTDTDVYIHEQEISNVEVNEYRNKIVADLKVGIHDEVKNSYRPNDPIDYPAFDKLVDKPMPSDSEYKEKLKIYESVKAQYEKKQEIENNSNSIVGNSSVSVNTEIGKELGKVRPTIVNITLYLADGHGSNRAVSVPLAIKSNLRFVDQTNIKKLIDNVDSPGKNLQTLIKLTSGEISFWKDWFFAIDSAKEDAQLAKSIGETPIFRRLMDAKNRYRIKSMFEGLPILKKFITSKTQKDLPMITIVLTEDELYKATNQQFSFLLKNKKFINQLMDTYMLLGVGVVDPQAEVIYFFYSGEDEPTIAKIKDIGGEKDNNINKKLTEVLANMSKLMVRR